MFGLFPPILLHGSVKRRRWEIWIAMEGMVLVGLVAC
jgi:hypothetical protein